MGALSLQELPRSQDVRLDTIVVTYTFAAAIVIGLVLGLIPVAATLSANVLGVLREEGRTATTGRGAQSLRRVLVVTQVGCAFLLLIGAGLLFASFRKVLEVNPGFTTKGVLTGAVSLPNARYADAEALGRFTREAVRRVRGLPGDRAAGATDSLPLGNSASASAIFAEGYQARPGESPLAPAEARVATGTSRRLAQSSLRVASSPNAMPRAPRAPSSWTTAWLGASRRAEPDRPPHVSSERRSRRPICDY